MSVCRRVLTDEGSIFYIVLPVFFKTVRQYDLVTETLFKNKKNGTLIIASLFISPVVKLGD